jgi:hypothetical protein
VFLSRGDFKAKCCGEHRQKAHGASVFELSHHAQIHALLTPSGADNITSKDGGEGVAQALETTDDEPD